jgi:hypothetical protein
MEGKDLVEVASNLNMDRWMVRDQMDKMQKQFGYSPNISKEEVYIFVKMGNVGLTEIESLALDYSISEAGREGVPCSGERFRYMNSYYRQRFCSLSVEFIRSTEGKKVSLNGVMIGDLKKHIQSRMDFEKDKVICRKQ